ncbi:endonuclease V [Sulfuricella denitrificans skB26]|uniref:Endonuclease V n=1 Tax=Sulfuricella denitrificans (strain DSM 22764 / NBRC 105220 / skB26) TaxID=1163617 RepID=S6B670_SULDS|nr:deoxyribonuclease V [Sulfuricella denitrificans]BAN36012.1 endonuclease V [Sulfuricella denitrificans skB26]
MKIVQRHPWDISPTEAIAIQQQLRGEVEREDRLGPVRHVAGVDVGFEEGGGITRAAVAVLAFPTLELVEHAIFRIPTRFPYVPGLLSFREVPAVIGALERLTVIPDLLLCDGQGIAHPRRFGIASHLGLLSGIPSIGVAKTRLIGEQVEPPDRRGAFVPLRYHGETIGAILRSRPGVKPLYISIGHRISLATALDFVMACVTRYRLPETTRWAHRLASGPAVE